MRIILLSKRGSNQADARFLLETITDLEIAEAFNTNCAAMLNIILHYTCKKQHIYYAYLFPENKT